MRTTKTTWMRTSEAAQTFETDRHVPLTSVCRYVVEKIFSHYIADDVGVLPIMVQREFPADMPYRVSHATR